MKRFYLGQCEYKWTHADTDMEHLWIRRELGDELYKTVESNNWEWHLLRSSSQTMPGDTYCRCDIYVDVEDSKEATLFAIQYSEKMVDKTHN